MYEKSVFLNCPFDEDYRPILWAITFAIRDAGYLPRSALEERNSATERLAKIIRIIKDCQYSIHDVSRVETISGGPAALPRFNMPFECGICFGAIHFGRPAQRRKELLVLDSERYRFQKTLSDIAGKDPDVHNNSPVTAISCVRRFLNGKNGIILPGEGYFQERYARFEMALPALVDNLNLTFDEIQKFQYWVDYARIADEWIKANPT